MIDMRDSRGIATFTVRFLLFYAAALLLFSFPLLPVLPGLTYLFSYGLMGFFTFIQVMAAISRKFLDQPAAWKAAVIAGAIVFDGAVLWLLGLLLVVVFDGGSAWFAVTWWLPSHAVAALCAWGLREFVYWLSPRDTATPSASTSPTDPAETENPGDSNDAEGPTNTNAETNDR
jgi:hypothetical protein